MVYCIKNAPAHNMSCAPRESGNCIQGIITEADAARPIRHTSFAFLYYKTFLLLMHVLCVMRLMYGSASRFMLYVIHIRPTYKMLKFIQIMLLFLL